MEEGCYFQRPFWDKTTRCKEQSPKLFSLHLLQVAGASGGRFELSSG